MFSLGYKTKKDLAKALQISPSDLNNRIKSGTVKQLLIDLAIHENVNIDWLLTGNGNRKTETGIAESHDPYAPAGPESKWPLKALIDEIRAQISDQRDKNKIFAQGILSNDKSYKDMWDVINRQAATIERLEKKCDNIFSILLEVGKDGDISHLKKIGGDGKC